MGTGEDLHEGLFFRTVPDLRFHRVASAVLHGLYPQVAVEEYKGGGDDHGDELACAFDGGGQGKALFRPLDSRVGIAEVELSHLDLPDFPVSVHEQKFTGEYGLGSISSFITPHPYPWAANVRAPTRLSLISSFIIPTLSSGIRMISFWSGFAEGISSFIIRFFFLHGFT